MQRDTAANGNDEVLEGCKTQLGINARDGHFDRES